MLTFEYKNNDPLIPFEIGGRSGRSRLLGYLDTGASDVVVPKGIKGKIDLAWLGNADILTVGGIIKEDIYFGKVSFLGKTFEVTIICKDLPQKEGLIGREILDHFKICFDGKKKEVKVIP